MISINLATGYLLSGGRRIPLTRGLSAIVDEEDFDRLNRYKWYARGDKKRTDSSYACRHAPDPLQKGKCIRLRMHRVVMGQPYRPNNDEVDHIDRNSLNNRKQNLRVVSHRENTENFRNQSQHGVGVWKDNKNVKYPFCVRVRVGNERYHIGCFATKEEAQIARREFLDGKIPFKKQKQSPYGKGICFIKNRKSKQFRATVREHNRTQYLGYFDTPEEARIARDDYLRKMREDS